MTTPRIRQDLQATPAEEQGIKYVDVSDPRSGAKMRLYDFEWLIAEQLNGSRRFDEVADYARNRLGLNPSASDIEAYAAKLAELGFIEQGAAAAPAIAELDEEPTDAEPTPLPHPVPAPGATGEMPALTDNHERMRAASAPTMAAMPAPTVEKPAEPKPSASPSVEKPIEPRLSTPAEKPAAAPTPSQQAAMAAGAPRTTGQRPATAAPVEEEAPKKSSAASLIAIILVLLAIGAGVAYMVFFRPQSAHVSVVLASPREVVQLYDGSAPVKKSEAMALSFGESGKVTDVVAKGTETKPGMPLATLDSYATIEKQLADVKDRFNFYTKQLESAKAKGDEAAIKAAEAKVAEKQRLMSELEARAGKVRLVAPGTGTVTDVLVSAGSEAKAGEPAVKVGSPRLTAEFKVGAPAEAPKVGDAVTMQPAAGGATIGGKVAQAANGAVTVELPDDATVKVGEPLRLVKKKEQNVVPVPAQAVVKRDGADVVFVLSDGEAKLRKVTVVDRTPSEALLSNGVAAGDSIITSNVDQLQEGQKVSTQ